MPPQDIPVMAHDRTGVNYGGWIVARIGDGPQADLICTVCGPTGGKIDAATARSLGTALRHRKTVRPDRSQGTLQIQCPYCLETTQDFNFETIQIYVCPVCMEPSVVEEYVQ